MRFGIIQESPKVEETKKDERVGFDLNVSVVKHAVPDAAEQTELGKWLLKSFGVVSEPEEDHPALLLLLELARKRREGSGLSGVEAVDFLKVGKTQTYYWLNQLRAAGLVSSGKQKLIEQGAIRNMKGFYLSGSDLNFTVEHIKKNVNIQLQEIQSVANRLHKTLIEESKVRADDSGDVPKIEVPGSESLVPGVEVPGAEVPETEASCEVEVPEVTSSEKVPGQVDPPINE